MAAAQEKAIELINEAIAKVPAYDTCKKQRLELVLAKLQKGTTLECIKAFRLVCDELNYELTCLGFNCEMEKIARQQEVLVVVSTQPR